MTSPSAPAPPLILVVEDDRVTRHLIRRTLESLGYTDLIDAEDGTVAQRRLAEQPEIALVISDILMPNLDGLQLLRWAQDQGIGAVWILLSGLDTFDTAVEAIRAGAFDFLTKPPERAALEVAVRNGLEHRRLLLEQERLYGELEQANRQLLTQVRELEDKSDLLRRDLQRAEVIQRALLPKDPPPIERYCIQAVYRPGRHVGGDLYDVVRLDDRHVAFYVADATGHGVTAAMLSVLFKQRLTLLDGAGRPLAPAAVLGHVNRAFCDAAISPGLFLTAAYCLLDAQTGIVRVASAGHPPALHIGADGATALVRRTGPALGLTANARYDEVSLTLAATDRLVLYTDGLLEAVGATEPQELRRMLQLQPADSEQVVAGLLGELQGRNGGDHQDPDDVTLLLLDVRVGASRFDNGASAGGERAGSTVRPGANVVFYGETDEVSWLALRGRVTWQQSDMLYEAACALLESHRAVVIDLSACDYMDSTALGVIHQLVERGDVRLHAVPPQLESLFEELAMERVLSAIDAGGAVPPELHPVAGSESGSGGRLQILRAHEALAALSARNQERFRGVVDALRRDLERSQA